MKIEISGKGGSGKSTLSVLMARALTNRGYRVLLVDGDESNVGLENLVGISPPVHLLEYLGGKKGFKEKINQQMMMDNPAGVFSGKQKIKDIPGECIASSDGIHLLIIGKIHHFGEGCACPIGVLSKKFLSSIDMGDNEVILMDTEAGVEHFGRGIVGECDLVLCVIDPTAESFNLARKMEAMAAKANKKLYFILNKVDPSIEPVMRRHLDEKKIIGSIPKDEQIFMESLEGRKISKLPPEIDRVCDRVLEGK